MTMLKPKASMSPVRFGGTKKRSHESPNATNSTTRPIKVPKTEEPRFTFDEVKSMIERLLSQQKKTSTAITAGLKQVNFDEVAVPGHSVQGCKDLIERLVKSTRRVRTLQEVLTDIKDNLNKRTYTEIIHRASLDGDAPKRPPSAYLLYHQDRYNQLKHESPLAAEVSKIVAEEWKTLSDRKRREYQRRHDDLMKKYESDMRRLGLIDEAAPKRPKSARALYISHRLSEMKIDEWDKEQFSQTKDELGREFDNLDPEDKKSWVQLHKDEQQEYQRAREEYIAAHPHLDHAQPERTRAREAKLAPPVPPKSALKFFLQKKIPEGLEGQEYDDLKKKLKEKFQTLSDKKLLKYIKKAVKDKERYDYEVQEFKAQHPDYEISKTKPSISKEQWKLYATKVENRPTQPAPTAYLHYCGKLLTDMHVNDLDNHAPTKRMQNASNSWRELSPKERQNAEREHHEAIMTYIDEMENWLANQTDERRKQVLSEEPKANPDYWRKKLNRLKKAEKKRKEDESM